MHIRVLGVNLCMINLHGWIDGEHVMKQKKLYKGGSHGVPSMTWMLTWQHFEEARLGT